jgi:CheY-like chemotaxis protein
MQSLRNDRPYDVILMDIQMPKMNGKEAAKWLRENQWEGAIIAITSQSSPKDHAAFLNAGCSNFLAKPITKTSLQQAISPCLRE